MRTLAALLFAGALTAACTGDLAETNSESAPRPASLGSSAEPDASASRAPAPVAPTLPPDPGYRSRLGKYADVVLGDALVPYGSPEHLHFLASCLESVGFKVDVRDGAIIARPAPEQADYYDEAQSQCEQDAIDGGLVRELHDPSDDELAAWYEAHFLTYQCLVEKGFPTSPPPSMDSYIEAGGRNWHPYDAIVDTTTVEVECPQDIVAHLELLASRGER